VRTHLIRYFRQFGVKKYFGVNLLWNEMIYFHHKIDYH
jgi:hypothetical protein